MDVSAEQMSKYAAFSGNGIVINGKFLVWDKTQKQKQITPEAMRSYLSNIPYTNFVNRDDIF